MKAEGDREVSWWTVGCGLAALVSALALRATARPDRVEIGYVETLFAAIRAVLARVVGLSPVSLAEVCLTLLVLVVLWRIAAAVRGIVARRRSLSNVTLRAGASAVTVVGVGYLLFLLVWGLCYHRRPVAEHLGLEPGRRPTAVELTRLIEHLSDEAARLRRDLAEDAGGVMRVEGGARRIFEDVGAWIEEGDDPLLRGPAPPLRVAWSSGVLTRLGISGIYVPFTGEPHVNGWIPDVSLPFVALHEAAHAAGWASEDEANFVAWRVASRSTDPAFRYSAAYTALGYALATLAREDRDAVSRVIETIDPAVQRDRAASRAFWTRYRSALTSMASEVNDAYLKSQGEEEGVASYRGLVDLIVALRRRGG